MHIGLHENSVQIQVFCVPVILSFMPPKIINTYRWCRHVLCLGAQTVMDVVVFEYLIFIVAGCGYFKPKIVWNLTVIIQ